MTDNTKVKELLKEARLKLIEAQEIIKPTNPDYFLLTEVIAPIEELIQKIQK